MPDIYAVTLTLQGEQTEAQKAFIDAAEEWLEDEGLDLPAFDFEQSEKIKSDDGGVLTWEPFVSEGHALLELSWRYPEADSGVAWTHRLVCYPAGDATRVTVQVSNTAPDPASSNSDLDPVPYFVRRLAARTPTLIDGWPVEAAARVLTPADMESFVNYQLLDRDRRMPIGVMSPLPDGSYVVDPDQLARELMTLARVYVIDHPESTFSLSDEIGDRRLSSFNGALRMYLPGFRRDSDPMSHRLLLSEPLSRADRRRDLAYWLCKLTLRRFFRDQSLLELREEKARVAHQRMESLLAEVESKLEGGGGRTDWKGLARDLWQENRQLVEQLDESRDRIADLERKVAYFESDNRGHERSHERGDRHGGGFRSVADAVEAAANAFGDSLQILPTAQRSARETAYRKPAEIYRALSALSSIAGRSRESRGTDPIEALRAMGFEAGVEKPKGPAGIRDPYEFSDTRRKFTCDEFIKIGPPDSSYMIKIYFTSKVAARGRWVVGHVGKPLDTQLGEE